MAFPSNRPGNRVVIGSTGRTAIEPRDGTPSHENTQEVGTPARKTLVGATGRSPIKTIATARSGMPPIKTVVGNTKQPPIKTVVNQRTGPPKKTITGSTAAPPRRTTPGNLGTGGIGPLGMDAADRGPINAANPSTISRSLGTGDGNIGRSVGAMPPPSPGPANASLDWAQPWNTTGIQDGGMGPAAKQMAPPARPRGPGDRAVRAAQWNTRGPREIPSARGAPRRPSVRRPSQFFGE